MKTQSDWELIEILNSLRGRRILSSAAVTIFGPTTSHSEIDSIAGHNQGGTNRAEVVGLTLVEDDRTFHDYEEGLDITCEVWLCVWEVHGCALLLIVK